jgi:bis(5'-nucleosyl)-tetraphosphatase (symmetrical)
MNAASEPSAPRRTYSTPADQYFRRHGIIPLPSSVHTVLDFESRDTIVRGNTNGSDEDDHPPRSSSSNDSTRPPSVLVIGDVHGCLDELLELHEKAVHEIGHDFSKVILVGDLVNKGPQSAAVIRHVRLSNGWLSVRGNNDDGALAAALGDERRRSNPSYAWLFDTAPTTTATPNGGDVTSGDAATRAALLDGRATVLSDEDVMWMAELPYTIRIPGKLLGESDDTVVVHAGLIPGVALERQSVNVLVTVREIIPNDKDGESGSEYRMALKHDIAVDNTDSSRSRRQPWANVWKKKGEAFRVIFGHDARRGLQRYDNDHVIGLDTGVCYGGQLTGVILSSGKRTLVRVPAARTYFPVDGPSNQ